MKITCASSILMSALLAFATPVFASSPASDNACDGSYSGSDNFNGKNGGSGFNAWQLIPSANGGNSGSFIGNSNDNGGGGGPGINCASSKAWGLYANSGAQSAALRPFAGGGLIPGQSVSIDMDNGWINGPYEDNNVHEVQLLNGSGVMRFGFHYRGGAGDYQIFDASDAYFQRGTGIQFTEGGLHIVFTLLTLDTYSIQITRLEDNSVSTFSGTLGGTPGTSLQSVFLVNRNAGEGGHFDAFFNNIAVSCNGLPASPIASSDSPLCEGQDLHLTATDEAGGSYAWSGPNGFSSADQNPTISAATPAASGTYSVSVTRNGCTSAEGTTTVTINPAPAALSPSNNGPVCPGETLNLFANTTAAAYTWTGPDGFTSSQQNPSIANATAAAAGTYNLVVNSDGCSSPMGSTTVTVKSPPNCTISGPDEVCAGSTASFSAPAGEGLSYAWAVSGNATIDGAADGETVSIIAGNGGFSVGLTVTQDGCNSTCTKSVVNDQTAPVITCPASVTIECNASTDPSNTGSATATDNCSADIAITHSDVASGTSCGSTITRTWTATDAAGNSSSCTQTITLQDTTAPTLVGVPADLTLQCASEIPAAPNAARAWGMYANAGAISEAIRPLASALSVGQKFVIDFDNGFIDTGAATGFGLQNSLGENRFELVFVGGDAFYRVKGDGSDITTAIPYTGEGLHVEVTLTGADSYSVKIIRIQSGDSQTIAGTLRGAAGSSIDRIRLFNFTAGEGSPFDAFFNSMSIPGVASDSASDAAYNDGWQTGDNGGSGFGAWSLFGSGGADPQNFGRFIGNAAQNDGGDSTSDGDINSLDVTASDNCDAHVAVAYSESDNGASGCSGHPHIITRTWTATDDCGNSTVKTQTITQEDTEAPTLQGVPADTSVQCAGDVPAPATVTATDNCDANVVVQFSEDAEGDVITRTWTSTDGCGNSATASQTITIHDTIAPVVTAPANVTVECSASIDPSATGSASATDNCDSDPVITHSDSEAAGACAQAKTITRTWTATDASGNSASSVQTITVVDTTAPVLVGVPANATAECSAVPAPANVTATDGCDGSPTVTLVESTEAGSCAGNYTLTRTWTAVDACGNSASASQVIAVQDTTGPVLSGQGANASIECPASPSFTAPTASDSCDASPSISFTDSTAPGSCAGSHSVTRTWVAVDACGNESAPVSQTITVVDTTAPVLSGVPADASAECDSIPAAATVTASDSCAGSVAVSMSESSAAGSCPGSRTITRTWTAVDACGNAASASQTITVHDSIAPVLSGQGADASIEAPAAPSFSAPVASDNCDGSPAIAHTDVTTPGACAGSHSVTRTWIATDNCGNESTPVSQTITVVDTTAPVLSGQGAEGVVEAPAAPSFTAPTASDNADANAAISYSDVTNSGSCAATYSVTRTWIAADACGNVSEPVSQTIHVVDTTAPVLVGLPSSTSAECDSVPLAATVTANDNSGEQIAVGFQETVSPGDCQSGYTMTRIWTATDCSGNSSAATQTIAVSDSIAPTTTVSFDTENVLLNPSFELGSAHGSTAIPGWTNFGNGYQEAFAPRTGTNHAKAFGNFGTNENFSGWQQDHEAAPGQLWRASVYVMQPSSDPWAAANEAKLRLEFYDATNGQVGADSVRLKANTPKDIYSLLSVSMVAPAGTVRVRIVPTYMQFNPVTGTGSAYYDDAQLEILHTSIHVETLADVPAGDAGDAIAQDNCDRFPTVTFIGDVTNSGSGCSSDPIVIHRTFRSSDACGNTADSWLTIEVSDTTGPVLSGVPANTTAQSGNVPPPANVTATDHRDGNVAVTLTQSQTPASCGYTITRTWTATDACGNSSSASQTITVTDTTAPTLSGQGANATIQAPASPSFTAPTATDNSDPHPSIAFTDSTVPGGCPGAYSVTRTWVATDSCGNHSAPVSQTITVVDTTAPVLQGVPANTTISCGASPAPANVTATDANDAHPVVSMTSSTVGSTITRTWTATDACGNHSSASQTITVVDATAPSLTVPANVIIQCSGDTSPAATGNATGSDACSSVTISHSDFVLDGCGNSETILRTWVATDSSGNQTAGTQTVSVVDTIAPVITNPGNQTVAPIAQPAKFSASAVMQFNSTPIPAGRTIWFNSSLHINHEGQAPTTVWIENSKIVFTANSTTYTVAVPNGVMYVTTVTNGSTIFNAASNRWETTVPKVADDHAFLIGVRFLAPVNLPGNIVATWSGDFTGDRLGVTANWRVGAAVYTNFNSNYSLLGVKAVNGTKWSAPYSYHEKAGTPENYKSAVTEGATSRNNLHNNCGNDDEDYIGRRTREKHVIPKKRDAQMSICDGVVVFNEPTAIDGCGNADVECDPPSGSELGPGAHTIHATAVDECGNTSTCTFVVNVLMPLRVEFKSPLEDDNLADNMESGLSKTDSNWCADAPTTAQVINKFKAGSSLNHKVKLFDCDGNDVTDTANVTVKIDVTERVGTYQNSALVVDVPEDYTGNGDPGGVLELSGHHYQYNLKTTGFEAGTVDNSKFFRSVISVEYNSAPGVKVGIEDVILESK